MCKPLTHTFVLTACLLFASSLHAADSCQPVFDALIRVATTPNHSYTTTTTVNGSKATDAETIFANGHKFIRVRGKWMSLPVTSQEVVEQEKDKQVHGKSTCQLLRNESVNGQAAMLYSVQREYEKVKENGQLWISKATGLLLRAEDDFDDSNTNRKDHRSTRFEYANVQAPI